MKPQCNIFAMCVYIEIVTFATNNAVLSKHYMKISPFAFYCKLSN